MSCVRVLFALLCAVVCLVQDVDVFVAKLNKIYKECGSKSSGGRGGGTVSDRSTTASISGSDMDDAGSGVCSGAGSGIGGSVSDG